jgi:hypothetical protein
LSMAGTQNQAKSPAKPFTIMVAIIRSTQ